MTAFHPMPTFRPGEQLDLIAAMTRDFASSKDAEETMRLGLERVAEQLEAEAASLFLLENDATELVCVACHGPVDITGLRLPAGFGIIGRTVADNRPQMVRDARSDPDFGALVDKTTGFRTRSILCAPLSVRDTQLGAVEVINKRDGEGLFNDDDRRFLEALTASAALAILNARLTTQLLERERLQRELELAAEIQRGLLPSGDSPGGPIHGINVAARQVSGDFYDYLTDSHGRLWFCVGDVSGKGMDAALMMAKTASLFRLLAKHLPSPGPLMTAINAELVETARRGMFVTMVAGMISADGRTALLANAGHEPPQVIDRTDGSFTALPADIPPLGILPDITDGRPFPEEKVALEGRDLYVFTDGFTEAATEDGGMLGIEALTALLRDVQCLPAADRLNRLVNRLRRPERPLRDDLTMVLVQGPEEHP